MITLGLLTEPIIQIIQNHKRRVKINRNAKEKHNKSAPKRMWWRHDKVREATVGGLVMRGTNMPDIQHFRRITTGSAVTLIKANVYNV